MATPPDQPQAQVRAVVDRISGDIAVLLVEPHEAELHLPAAVLPAEAREGTVLRLRPGHPPTIAGVDTDETRARHAAARERLERLRAERGGGRFEARPQADDAEAGSGDAEPGSGTDTGPGDDTGRA